MREPQLAGLQQPQGDAPRRCAEAACARVDYAWVPNGKLRLDLFHWPLAAFLALGLLYHAVLLLKRRDDRKGQGYG